VNFLSLRFFALFCTIALFGDNPFSWSAVSDQQIEEWVEQFPPVHQTAALKLLSCIDYYGPLVGQLQKDGLGNI
jgi:hypothetical protein